MNYWLITTEFPPIHGGGISTYCWHTAKMISQKGHQVSIFINDYSVASIKREEPLKNVTLIRFNPNQDKKGEALGIDARLSLEFSFILEQEMKTKGVPDVLETQDYKGIGYYTLLKKKLLYPLFKDLKVIMTMHAPSFLYFEYNQIPLYQFPNYWTGEMEKASIKMSDLVVSPSNYLIKELETRVNIKAKNPIRIFNPYFNEWSNDDVPEYSNGDLVFFGKLTPQKGALEMLSYLKSMWDNGFSKSIAIIGGGQHFFYPMQEDMIDYIKRKYKKYIDNKLITFEGNLPPEKLKERLKKAHIIITPSIVDNLPYAILEAMAMGKIVLASTNGGHIEILKHNESGFTFNHKIKNSFEDTLEIILNKNKEELNIIGKKAQKAVYETTNYERVYSQKLQEIENLLKEDSLSNKFEFVEEIPQKELKFISPNKQKDLLSIVIPYYNMGNYIEDTLQSLEKITYSNTEIIVINDGSDDENSIKKLGEIKGKYKLKVFDKDNEGLSLTRNFGAEKSSGEFIAFLDADDTVSPQYYENAITVLKKYNNVSFVGCWAQYFGTSNDTWPTFNPEPPYLLTHNMINSSALVYKKDDFINFGKNDPNLIYGMEDYDSVISMVKNGARGVVFPELWWQYRIRPNSMAQSFNKNKELFLYQIISKKHQDFFDLYGNQVSNILNQNGPGINFNNPTFGLKTAGIKQKLLSNKLIATLLKNNIIRNIAKKTYSYINKKQ